MKVRFPEPVAPVILYEFCSKARKYEKAGLELQLKEVEMGLDMAYAELLTGKYMVIDYKVRVRNQKKEVLALMTGGFDLSVREAKVYSLPEFQEGYKKSFKDILENYRPETISIDVRVAGSRDKITRIIEAKSPYKNKKRI